MPTKPTSSAPCSRPTATRTARSSRTRSPTTSRFTSPYDDAIDKATYFERCWPNSERIESNDVERIFEHGDEAFVTYRVRQREGEEFRNTEFFMFEGDRVKSIDVYFGATYRDGVFVKQKSE